VIKPRVFEFFPAPREPGATTDPQRSADYFNWYLDLWPRAELLGYEGIFFSEHHFGPAYSPAPNLLIAQVALKRRTIRLGVMGLVLPYHQPWKIVEEIGMLDHLTQGRLEIGTAAGIPQETGERHSRRFPGQTGCHASRQILAFRRVAPGAAADTAPGAALVGDGRQQGFGAQGGAPRRQDLHRVSPARPGRLDLRRLPR
jgi:alkanesulfonate monooxygenase SsuD/methylene tetrahydromethanopterin reductase-like flavin-dependent oxidoreductase (luciferase family)